MSIIIEIPELTSILSPVLIATAYSTIGYLVNSKGEAFNLTKFSRVILLSFITALGLNLTMDVPSDLNAVFVPFLAIIEEQFVKRYQDNNKNGVRDDLEEQLCPKCAKILEELIVKE